MTEANLRFCKDCKHFEDVDFVDFGLCNHPNNMAPAKRDLISGDLLNPRSINDPYDLRHTMATDPTKCGDAGRWWEPK